MNAITGVGWIAGGEYGCLLRRLRHPYPDLASLRSELQEQSILSYPMKRFGKYDLASKMTCCVSALALYDSGLTYTTEHKKDIGLLGSNTEGCLQSNIDFFEDFVSNGRTRGRGSIFVYTLPSIPISEAASYFNFRGPLIYMAFRERRVQALLSLSDAMIRRGEAIAMLAVTAAEEDALCFVLERAHDASDQSALRLQDVAQIERDLAPIPELIEALARKQGGDNSDRALRAGASRKETS